ncbi:hypothetical protein TNCV_1215511 [Trichonephila clavipes]|nr:hypothetical protein TNCV_1215511 [Trichonephila clavipes]
MSSSLVPLKIRLAEGISVVARRNQEAKFDAEPPSTDRRQSGIDRVQCIGVGDRRPSWLVRRAGSQWRHTPKKSCPVVRRKRETSPALARYLRIGLSGGLRRLCLLGRLSMYAVMMLF